MCEIAFLVFQSAFISSPSLLQARVTFAQVPTTNVDFMRQKVELYAASNDLVITCSWEYASVLDVLSVKYPSVHFVAVAGMCSYHLFLSFDVCTAL